MGKNSLALQKKFRATYKRLRSNPQTVEYVRRYNVILSEPETDQARR